MKESQTSKLLDLLDDGYPHSTVEIQQKVYGGDHLGCARIASRISDLRKQGHLIPKAEPDKHNPTISWYRLIKVNFNGVPIEPVKV